GGAVTHQNRLMKHEQPLTSYLAKIEPTGADSAPAKNTQQNTIRKQTITKQEYESAVKLRNNHLKAVKKLPRNIPRLRSYAFTENYWLCCAGLHKAVAERGNNSKTLDQQWIEAVQRLEAVTPKLFVEELQEPTLPKLPLHPLTGKPMTELPHS